jgi:lysophospholipase L1-like esterase
MLPAPLRRTALLSTSAVGGVTVAWSVRRDLRRVRSTERLDPPAEVIAVDCDPAGGPGDGHDRPPVRLAALGDSSIAGIGGDRVEDCLAVQIGARVAEATGRRVHVRGYGVSGARTSDVAARQVAALAAAPPADAVVVVVGANDVVHVTPPWRYRWAVTDLYAQLIRLVDAPVVACSLPEVRAITIVGHPLRDVATVYGRVLDSVQRRTLRAMPGVAFVDARRQVGRIFLRRPEAMARDGFHPSRIGYALLAVALAPAVVGALTTGPAGEQRRVSSAGRAPGGGRRPGRRPG